MNKFFSFCLQVFADTTVPLNLVRKAWAKDLWTAAMKELYFNKFMGEGPNNIIQRMTNLQKEAGDRITIPLMMKLTGDGVMDDADLEGNEEALTMYDFTVQVHEYAHAVRLKGKLEEQKTAINLRQAAKQGLTTWLQEKVDKLIFDALTASPTADRIIFPGAKTAENLIASTDLVTTDMISKARRKAQLANPKIRPVMVNGKPHYVAIFHPYMTRDLKLDTKWQTAQQYANVRGDDNPIFSGALGVWDNVVIHEHENISITATGASSAKVGHGLLLGAQAGALAIAQETNWEEKTFNYNKRVGFETDTILGVAKSIFNSVDFATVQLMASGAAD